MKKDYLALKKEALGSLDSYMDSLGEKKGAKLAYWVNDYVRFLQKETTFDAKKLIRYKRGAIVKTHLGYRVGSEEGGLHYAVVMDVDNKLSNPTATVIPLTSIKPTTDLQRLHPSKVLLGDEIYQNLLRETSDYLDQTTQIQNAIAARQSSLLAQAIDPADLNAKLLVEERRIALEGIAAELAIVDERLNRCNKMLKEIEKMKQGSIALAGQITTISKIRIYDPLYPSDVLSNIRLSGPSLDKLDAKIKELYVREKSDTK